MAIKLKAKETLIQVGDLKGEYRFVLGTERFGVRAKSVAKVDEVASGIISTRRVIFTPNSEIKEELQKTSIQITCYDRKGNIIKTILALTWAATIRRE